MVCVCIKHNFKLSLLKISYNFVHFTLGISDEKSERAAENNS